MYLVRGSVPILYIGNISSSMKLFFSSLIVLLGGLDNWIRTVSFGA